MGQGCSSNIILIQQYVYISAEDEIRRLASQIEIRRYSL